MKILETQSALLTNYEVFKHLTEQREQYKKAQRRGPPNVETVVRELLGYLRTHPNPLSQQPLTYTPECIAQLLESLRPYELTQGELLVILNLRPAGIVALSTMIEDMEERFQEDGGEKLQEILDVISRILGGFERQEEEAEGDEVDQDDQAADVSMEDATTA